MILPKIWAGAWAHGSRRTKQEQGVSRISSTGFAIAPDATVITAGTGGGDLAAHAQQSGQRYIMPRYLKAADLASAGSIYHALLEIMVADTTTR